MEYKTSNEALWNHLFKKFDIVLSKILKMKVFLSTDFTIIHINDVVTEFMVDLNENNADVNVEIDNICVLHDEKLEDVKNNERIV